MSEAPMEREGEREQRGRLSEGERGRKREREGERERERERGLWVRNFNTGWLSSGAVRTSISTVT